MGPNGVQNTEVNSTVHYNLTVTITSPRALTQYTPRDYTLSQRHSDVINVPYHRSLVLCSELEQVEAP